MKKALIFGLLSICFTSIAAKADLDQATLEMNKNVTKSLGEFISGACPIQPNVFETRLNLSFPENKYSSVTAITRGQYVDLVVTAIYATGCDSGENLPRYYYRDVVVNPKVPLQGWSQQ